MNRATRIVVWLFVATGVLVFAAGCAATAGLWLASRRPVTLPAPTGPYAVGRIGYDWVDAARADPYSPDPQARRELMVWVWYPADPAAPAQAQAAAKPQPAPYLPDAWRKAREQENGPLGSLVAGLLAQNLADVQAHAVLSAPLSAAQPAWPVLVMQPGLGPLATDYTTLAEDLASHGYIVAASTPTYSASVVVFADGRLAHASPAANVADDATPAQAKAVLSKVLETWVADNRFVLDRLAGLNADASQPFTGRLDLGRMGVWGHSFGGASAAETCARDARCKAGADLDGYLYGDVVERGLPQPFLFVWSEPDTADANWQQASRDLASARRHMPGEVYQVTVPGARHFNFSDLALFDSPLLRLEGLVGSIDPERGLRITGDYLLAFFDHTLRGVDSPLLHGAPAQ